MDKLKMPKRYSGMHMLEFVCKESKPELFQHLVSDQQPAGMHRPDLMEQGYFVEVWGTDFSNPGPDYCMIVVLDISDKVLGEVRINGY